MPFPLRISTSKSIKKNIFGLSGIIISATPSPHIFSQMPNFSIDLLIGSCLIAPKVYSYRYAVNSLKYKLIRIVYIGWIQYIVKLFITLIGHFFWRANWVMRNPIIDHPCTGERETFEIIGHEPILYLHRRAAADRNFLCIMKLRIEK